MPRSRKLSRWVATLAALLIPAAPTEAQQLQDCSQFGPTAQCAWYEVLEDRANPDGRTIDLRVVVLPARNDTGKEPVVWFPGGPGQSASALIPLASQVYGPVQESRDLVFIGQRGTGESNPIHCTVDVAADPSSAFGGLFNKDRIRECYRAAREHADPAHYATAEYIDDIAEVLTAFGYDRAILWGGSGGTRTAQAFLREHPDRVVAAVMDGVTPIDYRMPLPFSRYAQRAWERVVADCDAQESCADAFPALAADFESILDRLAVGPTPVEIRLQDGTRTTVRMTRGDFAYAVRGILYNAQATAGLPAAVHRGSDSGDLSFFAQSLFSRSVALRGTVLAMGLHLSVYCAEDVPRIERGSVGGRTEGTFLGSYLMGEYGGACEVWPMPAADADWFEPARSAVPVLLISGYYDPSTPDAAAERVARTLSNHLHIVVRNAGHGAGFGCARPAALQVMTSGSLVGVENECPDEPIAFTVGGS